MRPIILSAVIGAGLWLGTATVASAGEFRHAAVNAASQSGLAASGPYYGHRSGYGHNRGWYGYGRPWYGGSYYSYSRPYYYSYYPYGSSYYSPYYYSPYYPYPYYNSYYYGYGW